MKILQNRAPFNNAIVISENAEVILDLIGTVIGDVIGSGVFRATYENPHNKDTVIKIETGNNRCNIQEQLIRNEVQGLDDKLAWVKEWFAPVERLSSSGRLLCMARTIPHNRSGKKDDQLPDEIPEFLWDAKLENFGRYKGKFVCHDYGNIYGLIKYSKKMRRVTW